MKDDGATTNRVVDRLTTAVGWLLLGWFIFTSARLHHVSVDVRAFQWAYVLGFAGYGLLAWRAFRHRTEPTSRRHGSTAWRWWLIACALVRIPLLTTQPSDDLYRYVWEGRVQLEGANPFVTPPFDAALAHLRDADWARINHPDYPAIYPPLAQLEFAVIAAVYPSVFTFKLVHVLWDLLTVAVLGACLMRARQARAPGPVPTSPLTKGGKRGAIRDALPHPAQLARPELAVVYGLCPLVLTSFGIDGHVDSLMLLLAALSIWAAMCDRWTLAGVALGGAIAAKLMPLVLLPWFLLRRPRAALVAILVAAACYLPYLGAGKMLFASLTRFGTGSEFFSFAGVLGVAEPLTDIHRLALPALLGAILVILALRSRCMIDYAAGAWTATLLLLPVVHFWYLTWVIVLLPLRLRLAWLITGAAFVCYFEAEHQRTMTGDWSMPTWAPVVVWTVFVVACVTETVIRRARCRSS